MCLITNILNKQRTIFYSKCSPFAFTQAIKRFGHESIAARIVFIGMDDVARIKDNLTLPWFLWGIQQTNCLPILTTNCSPIIQIYQLQEDENSNLFQKAAIRQSLGDIITYFYILTGNYYYLGMSYNTLPRPIFYSI